MPFVSSVRGSYGVQSRLRGQTGRLGTGSTGGTITTAGGYRIHAFTAVGTSTFVPDSGGTVEYLIIGGGGGGGAIGGGGGAGGYRSGSLAINQQNYSIVVGNGGIASGNNDSGGTNGGDSSAFNLISSGGGFGGSHAVDQTLHLVNLVAQAAVVRTTVLLVDLLMVKEQVMLAEPVDLELITTEEAAEVVVLEAPAHQVAILLMAEAVYKILF